MQAKRPKGRGLSWRNFSRMLVFCSLMMIFLTGAVGEAFATATLTVKFENVSGISNLVLISVRTLKAETAEFLGAVFLTNQNKQVQLKVKAVPQIVFADLYTSDGNKLSGNSHVLWLIDRKKLTITLRLNPNASVAFSETTNLSEELFSTLPDTAGGSDAIGRVGVPSSGIAVAGLNIPAEGIAEMVITDLARAKCYGEDGNFVVISTDPKVLDAIQKEIELNNSQYIDPAYRVQGNYVPPDYFVGGDVVSDGTTVAVTYRLVDSAGNVIVSLSGAGPHDEFFKITEEVAQKLGNLMCCNKSKKIKCAKTGSIDIDVDYDILHPDCPIAHQSIQGNIKFNLVPNATDPQNVCEYVGNGTSYFKSDAECVNGLFQHTTCTVSENIVGRVPKPAFPYCNALVVDFTEIWDCIEVDSVGTHSYSLPAAWTERFQYTNGSVVDYPVQSPVVGHVRMILHLK